MKNYKHLFFDLDRTLWDYDTNIQEILTDLFVTNLQSFPVSQNDFISAFWKYSQLLWEEYRNGKISKDYLREQRFVLILKELGLEDNGMSRSIADAYFRKNGEKTNLFPESIAILQYLTDKKYHLHIITNGFNDVQFRKIRNSGLEQFFKKIVTSDLAGRPKPHAKIFEYALSSVNARKSESIMIGDDWEVDILGAKSFGIDQIYINPIEEERLAKEATYKISTIGELRKIL